MKLQLFAWLVLLFWSSRVACAEPVTTATALQAAVREGKPGDTIQLAKGTFELDEPLDLKAKMTLKGAGMDNTILTHTKDRKPSAKTLPDPEMKKDGLDTSAYLIRLQPDTSGVTISDLTLKGPQLHGAIFAWFHTSLKLQHLRVQEFQWCGVRAFGMKKAAIHDCEFLDAGGRWEAGKPGVNGGITGGGIFAVWMEECEIHNNRFTRTRLGSAEEYYGLKIRQAKRCHIHHNTIAVNFAMEFPFENDEDNEIDHNICKGVISIPKYAGGPVPKSGRTFQIHHNMFTTGYAIEFVRNGVEIDHNLFDFDAKLDDGNLISAFGEANAKGPASFHNNLVKNPGRGVMWMNEVFDNLDVRNNHIICNRTATPRTDGLFGFNPKCDFKTIRIIDNLIECHDQSRPLLRSEESTAAFIQNNTLVNVSDARQYKNAQAKRTAGLEKPLAFACGVQGELTVTGWLTAPTKRSDR